MVRARMQLESSDTERCLGGWVRGRRIDVALQNISWRGEGSYVSRRKACWGTKTRSASGVVDAEATTTTYRNWPIRARFPPNNGAPGRARLVRRHPGKGLTGRDAKAQC